MSAAQPNTPTTSGKKGAGRPDDAKDAGPRDAAAWAHMVGEMKRAATHVDWSKIDLSKLAPKDIGVHVGPMMTEEQFKEYRARSGSAGVHVVKAPAKQ